MRYLVRHRTSYSYADEVFRSYNVAHMRPRSVTGQTCADHLFEVDPAPVSLDERLDFFGNHVTAFVVEGPLRELVVTATSQVDVVANRPADAGPPWEAVRRELADRLDPEVLDARQHCFDSPHVQIAPELADYASVSFRPGRPVLEAAVDLARRVHREFVYEPGTTTVATPVGEVLRERRGVCQDFAHVAIGCIRSMGLAARYVSGYLRTLPPTGSDRLLGADASHAWFSLYVPGGGWVDVDPTNDLIVDDAHVTTAWGRDYGDVSPLQGVVLGGGGYQSLEVSVDVVDLP